MKLQQVQDFREQTRVAEIAREFQAKREGEFHLSLTLPFCPRLLALPFPLGIVKQEEKQARERGKSQPIVASMSQVYASLTNTPERKDGLLEI